MSLLTPSQLQQIVTAATASGLLAPNARNRLLDGLPPAFVALLDVDTNPLFQFRSDLARLDRTPRLADGTVPLVRWLDNAAALTQPLPEGKVFRALLDQLSAQTSGQELPPEPDSVPEWKEAILFGESNLLPFSFLASGAKAGQAVAHLSVPRYESGKEILLPNGKPLLFNGTAWLLTNQLAITNHHVVQAREASEPPANLADMRRQTAGSKLRFDFDAEGAAGTLVAAKELVAFSKPLDYAILRLAETAAARPLPVLNGPIQLGKQSLSVNIIQHPDGGPKQVCVRRNQAVAAKENDLYYLTDTKFGSSGSPVCNDQWQVLALHRGSRVAEDIPMQGPRPAFFNVGTPIRAILQDLLQREPAVFEEISGA